MAVSSLMVSSVLVVCSLCIKLDKGIMINIRYGLVILTQLLLKALFKSNILSIIKYVKLQGHQHFLILSDSNAKTPLIINYCSTSATGLL